MFSRTEELLNGIVKIAEDDVLQEKVKSKPKPTPGPPRVQHRRKIPLHSSKSSPHLFTNNSQNSNNNSNKTFSSKPTSPATNRRFTCKYLQCRCSSIFFVVRRYIFRPFGDKYEWLYQVMVCIVSM